MQRLFLLCPLLLLVVFLRKVNTIKIDAINTTAKSIGTETIFMSKGGHGVSGYTHTQAQLDSYADQHNPNNDAYQANLDNHANQCNPNNDEYAGHNGK